MEHVSDARVSGRSSAAYGRLAEWVTFRPVGVTGVTARRSYGPCTPWLAAARVYGGSVARRIVAFHAGNGTTTATERTFPDLTPRERGVLELLALGFRNHEISRRLSMSEKTVQNHVSQVLTKLQLPDRTAA